MNRCDFSSLFAQLFTDERESRVAILYDHREISYGELRDETVRVADALNGIGVTRRDRVAILLADSPEFITSFVAVISLGAIAVPINLALPREQQIFILKDCGAIAGIFESETVSSLLENSLPPDLKNVVLVRCGSERTAARAELKVHDFRTAERQPFAALSGGRANSPEHADAFILYTSGSTGEPKGAVHSQADIFYTNKTYCRQVLNLRAGDRLFSSSRLPFAYGLGNSFTFPLLNGHTTILCREKPTPEIIARVFQDYRPTIFFGVPVVYRMLLDHHRSAVSEPRADRGPHARSARGVVDATGSPKPSKDKGHGDASGSALYDPVATARGSDTTADAGRLDTSSLRLCVSAGEALPAQLGQEWQKTFGLEVLDGIGSTEMLHMWMSNHEGDLRYGSSGKLLRGYDAKLIDHDGVAMPTGEVGNLWISGNSAASRYWQRPKSSSETFIDGWTRTGDLYRRDRDGFWWHMGRSDDCFKPTGQWVSPIEVENVLLRHETVRAAAVVEGFDKDGLSCVCAFVVSTNANPQDSEGELRSLCETALPRFKQPRRYIFVSELPYTATGKVQRFKLRERLRSPKSHVQSPTSAS